LGGRGGDSFTRLSKEKQQAAVRFLLDNAFTTPKKLLEPSIVNRFQYLGVADAVTNQQSAVLASLLSGGRFRLLVDAEVLAPKDSYSAMQYLTDVQDGIWSELKTDHPQIDVCRRKLQRTYIEQLKNEISPKETAGRFTAVSSETDFRAVARAGLKDLNDRLTAALQQTKDPMTLAHLEDCRQEVDQILHPKK